MNKKPKKVPQAVNAALLRVEVCKNKIACLDYAVRDLRDRYSDSKGDYSKLRCELYGQLNDAYRDLFMFGCISLSPADMRLARKEAFRHYLSKDHGIMGYLSTTPAFYPSSYGSDEEAAFRKELEEEEKLPL
jgi:hypothetical protein